ncbi:MAG TPA: LUD domain-containing protein [Trebonia sp.]|nr:LUD domain-containing protein [Trebonia sp.]
MSEARDAASAREDVLARIRAASGGCGATAADEAYAAIHRGYLRSHHDPGGTDLVALFAERAADYRAVVRRVQEDEIAAAVGDVIAALPRRAVLAPGGVPDEWLAGLTAGTDVLRDDPPLSHAQLDQVPAVLTGCAVAIAETGTVVLDHGAGQGRRALTLLPDFHLAVVRAGQVAADLPDALERLRPSRPLTFISGPSATSDIELIRVEGVHGPRQLHILVAG